MAKYWLRFLEIAGTAGKTFGKEPDGDILRPKSSQSRKKPRKVTAESLERAALHYLERYASSAVNLRRVLMRRVLRAAEAHGSEPADGAALVDALVARFRQGGLLDDATYARLRAESLHRQGASRRLTRSKLAAKGVDGEDIGLALDALEDLAPKPDLAAACHYARRRRLGPWRRTGRVESRERDLAALGRQGFSYDIARAVIDAPDRDALEAEARGDIIGGP
jgi:regulatory protein